MLLQTEVAAQAAAAAIHVPGGTTLPIRCSAQVMAAAAAAADAAAALRQARAEWSHSSGMAPAAQQQQQGETPSAMSSQQDPKGIVGFRPPAAVGGAQGRHPRSRRPAQATVNEFHAPCRQQSEGKIDDVRKASCCRGNAFQTAYPVAMSANINYSCLLATAIMSAVLHTMTVGWGSARFRTQPYLGVLVDALEPPLVADLDLQDVPADCTNGQQASGIAPDNRYVEGAAGCTCMQGVRALHARTAGPNPWHSQLAAGDRRCDELMATALVAVGCSAKALVSDERDRAGARFNVRLMPS